jgi:hypothetical protein
VVIAWYVNPVSELRQVTSAWGTAAPEGSRTVPLSKAVDCADKQYGHTKRQIRLAYETILRAPR